MPAWSVWGKREKDAGALQQSSVKSQFNMGKRKPEGGIVVTDEIGQVAFDSGQTAGETYTILCGLLGNIPRGRNEEIDATLSGPEVDTETGDIEYTVSLVVKRKFPWSLLKKWK